MDNNYFLNNNIFYSKSKNRFSFTQSDFQQIIKLKYWLWRSYCRSNFFIAVFATNLFDQGIWQRVYASKNITVLKKGFVTAFFIVFITILLLGMVGIYASLSGKVKDPSTIIFSFINKEFLLLNLAILILSLTLVLSSLDTLIASVSSLFVIHTNKFVQKNVGSFYIIGGLILAGSAFYISSKGLSVLYLFLLADLLCCAAAIPVFTDFYNKKIKSKNIFKSIIFGITFGLLLFPFRFYTKYIGWCYI